MGKISIILIKFLLSNPHNIIYEVKNFNLIICNLIYIGVPFMEEVNPALVRLEDQIK